MLTKPPFCFAARPINAAKRGYSTYSTTHGFNGVSHRWGGRECTDPEIQSPRPEDKQPVSRVADILFVCLPALDGWGGQPPAWQASLSAINWQKYRGKICAPSRSTLGEALRDRHLGFWRQDLRAKTKQIGSRRSVEIHLD